MKLALGAHAAIADVIDAQIKILAAAAAALRGDASDEQSKYLDQRTSPLSARVFLTLARRGAFPTKRVGKRVLVERDVFERWLASQPEHRRKAVPSAPVSGPRSIDDEILAELGAKNAGRR